MRLYITANRAANFLKLIIKTNMNTSFPQMTYFRHLVPSDHLVFQPQSFVFRVRILWGMLTMLRSTPTHKLQNHSVYFSFPEARVKGFSYLLRYSEAPEGTVWAPANTQKQTCKCVVVFVKSAAFAPHANIAFLLVYPSMHCFAFSPRLLGVNEHGLHFFTSNG